MGFLSFLFGASKKKCKKGKRRHPVTKRCRKIKSKSGRRRRRSRSGRRSRRVRRVTSGRRRRRRSRRARLLRCASLRDKYNQPLVYRNGRCVTRQKRLGRRFLKEEVGGDLGYLGPILAKSFGRRRSLRRRGLRRFSRRRFGLGRRRFGKEYGPGYKGLTSYPGAKAAPYFGQSVPFVNPSNYWIPVANNQLQYPQMLYNFK